MKIPVRKCMVAVMFLSCMAGAAWAGPYQPRQTPAQPSQTRILPIPQGETNPASGVQGEDAELTALMERLSQIGELLSKTTDPALTVSLSLQEADLLVQIERRSKPEERASLLRQLIDCLDVAAANSSASDRTAYHRLLQVRDQLVASIPGSELAAYATYQVMQLDNVASQSSAEVTTPEQLTSVQEKWIVQMTEFARTYPHSEETPGVLLELATIGSILNKDGVVRAAYQDLAQNFSDKPEGQKAQGALNRINLENRVLHLTLPLLLAEDENKDVPCDVEELRGKVVIVYFWSSADQQRSGDFAKLKELMNHYSSKGLGLLCVNMDKTPKEARMLTKSSSAPGLHVFQRGGMEGPVALRLGVMGLPDMLLLDRDGVVIRRSIDIGGLEEEVKTQLLK